MRFSLHRLVPISRWAPGRYGRSLWFTGLVVGKWLGIGVVRALPGKPEPDAKGRLRPAIADAKPRQMEVVGPSGAVHYRRPEGDPLLDEALARPEVPK